jgi:hypothetical protein
MHEKSFIISERNVKSKAEVLYMNISEGRRKGSQEKNFSNKNCMEKKNYWRKKMKKCDIFPMKKYYGIY